jgi:hypothetical protein
MTWMNELDGLWAIADALAERMASLWYDSGWSGGLA